MARAPKRKAARGAKSSRKASARTAAPKRAPAPRRPPEVSAKDWKGYSASYRKRLAGFYAKHPGAPRYRARGKGGGEHLTRKARLEARMHAVAERQSYRGADYGSHSPAELFASYQAIVRDHGETAFTKIERLYNYKHAMWVEGGRPRSGDPAWRKLPPDYDPYDEIDWDWEDYDIDDADGFYR